MDPNTLLEIENLATQLYAGGTSNEARAEAERQLSVLSTNPDMLEHVRQVLERSALPFAQHLAATAITKQVTSNWGRFSAQQRMDMRNFVLTYLANKGPSVQVYDQALEKSYTKASMHLKVLCGSLSKLCVISCHTLVFPCMHNLPIPAYLSKVVHSSRSSVLTVFPSIKRRVSWLLPWFPYWHE
jgi:hypothetical protein